MSGAFDGYFWLSMACLAVIILGLLSVNKNKGNGYGPNGLKALGIVIFIPSLLIVTIFLYGKIANEAVVGVWASVGGYLLGSYKSNGQDG